MTTTSPPKNASWSNRPTDTTKNLHEQWKILRLSWLEQFDLEISLNPEKGFRYWRWLGNFESNDHFGHVDREGTRRKIVWSERRFWDESIPDIAGLWPADL